MTVPYIEAFMTTGTVPWASFNKLCHNRCWNPLPNIQTPLQNPCSHASGNPLIDDLSNVLD